MKIEEEKVSWNDVKEKYLKFYGMDVFKENMARDIDFGYWLANNVIAEALRWRTFDNELHIDGQHILSEIEVIRNTFISISDCNNSILLNRAEDLTINDFIEIIKHLRDEIN